jgi:heme exporter protein A
VIEARGVGKVFGLRPVLRGIDLNVGEGEFLTLFGPNGSGKTTFLRILSTLSKPTSGLVRIAGLELPAYAAAARRSLGMVAHMPLLYPDLSAEENLRLYSRLYGVTNHEERVPAALEMVGLLPRARDLVGTFSRGMQQRLAIARALLHEPSILLLDEPYTGLDQDAAAILDGVLRDALAAANRPTVLMTTHDLERGLAFCDRVAILSRGKIAYDAPRAEAGSAVDFAARYADLTGMATVR